MKNLKKVATDEEMVAQDYTVVYYNSTSGKIGVKKNDTPPTPPQPTIEVYMVFDFSISRRIADIDAGNDAFFGSRDKISSLKINGVECNINDILEVSEDGEDYYDLKQEYVTFPYTNIEIVYENKNDLGDYYMGYVSTLCEVVIPNSVTSIGDSAFQVCSSLTRVTYYGTKAQWNAITKGNIWKYDVPTTCKVHCTDGDINIADA